MNPSPPSLDSLRALLAHHTPTDAREREDLERMHHLAARLEQPLSRSQAGAHFTASAVVVDPAGARVVMLLHGKLQRWLQPGGHAEAVDAGDLEAAALREAREETGCRVRPHPDAPRPLDVDVHSIPARRDEPEHLHLDVRYLLVADNPEALAHDPQESSGAHWLAWDEALARVGADAPLERLLTKARTVAERLNR